MTENPKVLVVVTSHGDIDGKPTTDIWFSEFSEPFAVLREAGASVTVASRRGGPAPIDPRGYPSREQIADVRDALETLNATLHLDTVNAFDFDAIFLPGGHGPMFDLATNATLKGETNRLLRTMAPRAGLEPATQRLTAACSTD